MQQPKRNAEAILLFFNWIKAEKASILKIYFLAGLQALMYICIPLGIQGIITYTMAGRFTASLVILCLVTIIVTAFIGFFQIWQMRINETLQQKIFAQFVSKIHNTYKEISIEKISTKIAYYFEVTTFQKGIGKILLDFSFSVISILFGLLILPIYSSWFLIFSILLGLGFYLIVVYYGKKALAENYAVSNHKYNIFKWFDSLEDVENISNLDIKADNFLNQYIKQRTDYYKTFEKQYQGIFIFKIIFVSLLLFFGAYLVQIGEFTIGQFVASEIIVFLVINAIEKLVISLESSYDIATALSKMEAIFEYTPHHALLNDNTSSLLPSYYNIYNHQYNKKIKYLFYSLLTTCLIILVLPWTQNIDMKGTVSVVNPESKPQNVSSRIAGRIEKWYIQDGDLISKNDTIAFISEIKDDYMDTNLITRSQAQVNAKEVAVASYEKKINAIDKQIDALNQSLILKLSQNKNKLRQALAKLSSDSIEALAAKNNLLVVEDQYKRYEELFTKGAISKTDLENRKVKVQESVAKKISADNKIINSRNEILNAEIEINSIQQEYAEKLMKSESEKFGTMSALYDAEGSVNKLQNQLSNYAMRKSYYYVLAPQDGYVNNVNVNGVGEIIKEGGILCDIVPLKTEQAVEMYIDPVNLPLIRKGQKVQLLFDGWPSFVFSGWPGVSYGTFSAEILSYDRVISPNGKFRVLAINQKGDWPEAIQIGGGVQGFAMLGNVPLIYELWRQVNGFPPDFYKENTIQNNSKNKKASAEKNEDK